MLASQDTAGSMSLPLLQMALGGGELNSETGNSGTVGAHRELVSPRVARTTNQGAASMRVSQEVQLGLDEQRSTVQGLSLLLLRELVCTSNRAARFPRRDDYSGHEPTQSVSNQLVLAAGHAALNVVQDVSDVRVLGAAAGVLAHCVIPGRSAALMASDRSRLLHTMCQRTAVLQTSSSVVLSRFSAELLKEAGFVRTMATAETRA